jgi:hypothetical protein
MRSSFSIGSSNDWHPDDWVTEIGDAGVQYRGWAEPAAAGDRSGSWFETAPRRLSRKSFGCASMNLLRRTGLVVLINRCGKRLLLNSVATPA